MKPGPEQRRRVPRPQVERRLSAALDAGALVLTAGAGSGKSTALEQALSVGTAAVAWISCSEADRAPGHLVTRLVAAVAQAAPGTADVLAERLATAPEQIDAAAVVHELCAELAGLLVDPLVVVVDDAEHLEGAEGSVRVLSELVRADVPRLRVAIASRRELGLRVAKPRAHGRLAELGASDLAFDAEECGEAIRLHGMAEVGSDAVERVMEATEGWPLGVALAARSLAGGETADPERVAELASAPDVRAYLAEEILDALPDDLRRAAIDSAVPRIVTPEIAATLELPNGFASRVERAGLLVRRLGNGAFAYHPLLRELLVERLSAERDAGERHRVHAAVAAGLASSGERVEAIEHWLLAERWNEAADAIERDGLAAVASAPERAEHWLCRLPDTERRRPSLLGIAGQAAWLEGRNQRAIELLRAAVDGFSERPNPVAEWIARSILLDLLWTTGDLDAVESVVAGWDGPEAASTGGLAAAAALLGATCMASYGRFESSDRLAAAALDGGAPELLAPLDASRFTFSAIPQGRLDEVDAALRRAIAQLERMDPLNRRVHLLGALAVVLILRGEPEEALALWLDIREQVRATAPVLADACLGWCALLHAHAGRLEEAEATLSGYRGLETGNRAYIGGVAPATVAALRGDVQTTRAEAERALAIVEGGPVLFRFLVAADLVPPLAAVGEGERAAEIVDGALAMLEEAYPGEHGAYPRGRVLALRAWLRHLGGADADADADLVAFWADAGPGLPFVLRQEWPRLEPVVWGALERGAVEPVAALSALGAAFPGGLELVRFLEHPLPAVQAAALEPAIRSGDPAALEHLARTEAETEGELAEVVSRGRERLARALPPLRFEVLGPFRVRRGSWEIDEGGWARPVDARLVRFLLAQAGTPVLEDVLFEALWPQLEPPGARRSLQVSVSRVRRVLDPPGAERSVIESGEAGYRIALSTRDAIDAEDFRVAADAALASRGDRALLERARTLWRGEPLPEERYADWATGYRERLIDLYVGVLTAIAAMNERSGDHDAAIAAARDLIDADPLNEAGHRALIAAYARAGRRGHVAAVSGMPPRSRRGSRSRALDGDVRAPGARSRRRTHLGARAAMSG